MGALCLDGRRLFVSWSVCPVPDPKSRMERRGKVKICAKEAHDTGDPWHHLEIESSNACQGGMCVTGTSVSNSVL